LIDIGLVSAKRRAQDRAAWRQLAYDEPPNEEDCCLPGTLVPAPQLCLQVVKMFVS